MHNYAPTELNPYHLESDCWSHTMMVCKLAELNAYDNVVQIAALLHDIGKPASRKVNSRNNHVQFFGHEALSAEMAEGILDRMLDESIILIEEKEEIIQLVKHHAFLYKHSEPNAMMKYFNGNKVFCRHLVELIRCDSLGRFCSDLPDEEKFTVLLEEIEKY
jgi:putative nucleotidyltransferase with HDIG domain